MSEGSDDLRRSALNAFEEALEERGRRESNFKDSALITPKPLPSVRRRDYLESRAKNALKLNEVLRQRLAAVVEKLSVVEENNAAASSPGAAAVSVFAEQPHTQLDAAVLEHVVLGPSAAKRKNDEESAGSSPRDLPPHTMQPEKAVVDITTTTVSTQTGTMSIQKMKNMEAARSSTIDRATGKAITMEGKGRMYPIVNEAEMIVKATIPLKMLEISVDQRVSTGGPGVNPCKVKFDEDKLVFKMYTGHCGVGGRAPVVLHEMAVPYNHVVEVALGQYKKTFSSFMAVSQTLPVDRVKAPDSEISCGYDFTTSGKILSHHNQSLTLTFNTPESLEKSMDSTSKPFYNMINNPHTPQFDLPQELGQISLIVPTPEAYDIFISVLDMKLRSVCPHFLVPFDLKGALKQLQPGNQLATYLAMLSEDELEFCSKEHVTPQIYLTVKKHLLSPELSCGLTDLRDLRQYVDVDLLRLKRILWFLEGKKKLIRLHRVYKVDDAAVLAASGSGK